jgi:hypothetical protein
MKKKEIFISDLDPEPDSKTLLHVFTGSASNGSCVKENALQIRGGRGEVASLGPCSL